MGIPKTCHVIWIQGYDKLPEKNKQNYLNVQELNPEWTFIFWDDEKIINFLQSVNPAILDSYKNSDKYKGDINQLATKSDIARYMILQEFGGLYFDMDFICSAPFNIFNESDGTLYMGSSIIDFLSYIYPFPAPKYCSCFMASEPRHPVWETVVKKILNATDKKTIGEALDRSLQENENKYPKGIERYKVKLLDKELGGPYSCSCEGSICYTPTESSWNFWRPVLKFINCNFFLIIILVLVIIPLLFYFLFFNH